MRGNLKDNQAKLDSYEKSIKAALERKRKVIMESKQIAYDMLSELYGLEGQELVDTATIEHTLIGKLTASGMTYDQIAELADDSYDRGSSNAVPHGYEYEGREIKRNPQIQMCR